MHAAPSRRLLLLVFVVATAWALLGAGARATYGARLTADEPQYVLSALNLSASLMSTGHHLPSA